MEMPASVGEQGPGEMQIRSGAIDEGWLGHVEGKDNLFPELDFAVYRPV